MEGWWYVDGVTRVGPIDEDALKKTLLDGRIGPQTMIWRAGMPQWQTLSLIPELQGLVPPPLPVAPPPVRQQVAPPPLAPVSPVAPQAMPAAAAAVTGNYAAAYATPYAAPHAIPVAENAPEEEILDVATINQRIEARMVDMTLSFFIAFMILYVADYIIPPLRYLNLMPLLSGVVLNLLSFVLDALIYGIFGNTLAKYLLGIQVLTATSQKPDLEHYLVRNLKTWAFTFGCGIQVLGFFLMLIQADRLYKKGATYYDAGSGDTVYRVAVNPAMRLIGHLLAAIAAVYLGWAMIMIIAKYSLGS